MTIMCRRAARRSQHGAALLLAMLIVTLVATLAGGMVWQQWRAVQVEAAERARTQAAWILVGALDWARLILREDNTAVDHLGEPWAVPLAEARLSSFLAADNSNPDDGPEAFLSGSISDVQAHYNLGNLVSGGQVVAKELEILERLFDNIGVSPSMASTIATGLLDAGPASSNVPSPVASAASATGTGTQVVNPDPPLRPESMDQLTWLGIDRESIALMTPHVSLLPTTTTVNLNTASPEVIAAAIEGLDLAGAQRLVQARERSPFNGVADANAILGGQFALNSQHVGVTSSYFEVRGRLRLGERVLEERSLVHRVQRQVTIVSRERLNFQQ